ncbi:MAG: nucleoside deaminase [Herbaspirillum sp.]|jgi:tRNA(Arg) A34 adenosine deaminase TadA|nr:nucleoside deaminase [Herbaspirillum sp.]
MANSASAPAQDGDLHPRDEHFLRRALEVAERSRAAGRHPFGSIVVDEHGTIVAEAFNNSLPPDGDPTQHAERLVAAEAARKLSPEALSRSTLYTSAEPCAMCSGAIYWCNIGRVVYVLSERTLLALTGDHSENPTLSLPCREVFARGQKKIEVIGPVLALSEQAAAPHIGFWE